MKKPPPRVCMPAECIEPFRRFLEKDFPRFLMADTKSGESLYIVGVQRPGFIVRIDLSKQLLHFCFRSFDSIYNPAGEIERMFPLVRKYLFEDVYGTSFGKFCEGKKEFQQIFGIYPTMPLPKHLFAFDHQGWNGVVRTETPRFISSGDGTKVLPLDPCPDFGPFLQDAGHFFMKEV